MPQQPKSETNRSRIRPWHYVLAVLAVGVTVLMISWNWDWFLSVAQRQASSALGRPVTIQHLLVHLARNPIVEVRGLVIGNPRDFPDDTHLATVDRLAVT